jgi:hypothetical protein
MKRKLIILLALTVATVGITACGKTETTETEPTEVVETTEVVTEDTETELVEETESDTESLAEESSTSSSTELSDEDLAIINATEPSYDIVDQGDYPDSRSDHQANWDTFCQYYNESDYGTTTKGLTKNELPYCGPTGYDASLLKEVTTDKGYGVMYDTSTGRVYYSGMVMPIGTVFDDIDSDGAIVQYLYNNDLNTVYDLTYSQFQEILGTYNGN